MPSIRSEERNSLMEFVTTVEEASWQDSVHGEVLVLRESILASLWNFGCLLYVLQRLSPDSQTWFAILSTLWDPLSPVNRDFLMTREPRVLLALIWLPLMLGVSAGARVLGLVGHHQSECPQTRVGVGKVKLCIVALATIFCGVAADLTVFLASLGDPIAARMIMLVVTFGLQTLFLAASALPLNCIGAIYLSGSQAPLLPTALITRDSLDEKHFDISPHLLVIDVDSMEERLIGDA